MIEIPLDNSKILYDIESWSGRYNIISLILNKIYFVINYFKRKMIVNFTTNLYENKNNNNKGRIEHIILAH